MSTSCWDELATHWDSTPWESPKNAHGALKMPLITTQVPAHWLAEILSRLRSEHHTRQHHPASKTSSRPKSLPMYPVRALTGLVADDVLVRAEQRPLSRRKPHPRATVFVDEEALQLSRRRGRTEVRTQFRVWSELRTFYSRKVRKNLVPALPAGESSGESPCRLPPGTGMSAICSASTNLVLGRTLKTSSNSTTTNCSANGFLTSALQERPRPAEEDELCPGREPC